VFTLRRFRVVFLFLVAIAACGAGRASAVAVDGEIAYLHVLPNGSGDLFVMNSDGTAKANLTRSSADEQDPAWSPTGLRLAYQRIVTGGRRVYVLNPDTGSARQVSTGPFSDRFPAWSPNGRRIVYRSLKTFPKPSTGSLGSADLWVISSRGGARTNITQTAGDVDTDPSWGRLEDGTTKVVFASNTNGNFDLYAVDPDGQNRIQLTDDPADDRYPAWSPDGKSIAFVSTRDGNEEIYVMDVSQASGGLRINPTTTRLTNDPSVDRSPAWAPTGGKIAFASRRTGNYDIFVMSDDGTGTTQMTTSTERDWSPSWQPLDCTIVGTNGPDMLNGTPGDDVICGLGGNDTIDGRGGDDVIFGGPGNDTLAGGSGRDTIHGGRGNDTLRGGTGSDRLFGAGGRDKFFARDGTRDRVNGGPGRDRARVDAKDRLKSIEVRF